MHVFVYLGILLLGSAQDVPCSVTQGAGWTSYCIPEFSASSCHYSWANGTSYVVANHEEEMKSLVLNNSRITLIVNKCLRQVLYKRDCISEGISYHAMCNTTCNENADIRHDDGAVLTGTRHHYCLFAAFLLLVGLFLTFRFGKCSCFNTEADVEAQRG